MQWMVRKCHKSTKVIVLFQTWSLVDVLLGFFNFSSMPKHAHCVARQWTRYVKHTFMLLIVEEPASHITSDFRTKYELGMKNSFPGNAWIWIWIHHLYEILNTNTIVSSYFEYECKCFLLYFENGCASMRCPGPCQTRPGPGRCMGSIE